jgi:site-specific recombinase XerD
MGLPLTKALAPPNAEDFHVHRLGHTFATPYLEAGRSLEACNGILGHSTIKLTECYGRLRQRR